MFTNKQKRKYMNTGPLVVFEHQRKYIELTRSPCYALPFQLWSDELSRSLVL